MSIDTGTSAGPDPAATAARAVLGHGLALTSTGPDSIGTDLLWTDTAGGPAIGIVEGEPNLVQDLRVALLTPTGSDPFDTGFGFDGLRVLTLGTPAPLTEELLRLSVIRLLTSDARVAEVVEVALDPVGPDRRQRVTARIRTVLGEALQLTVGEVENS